MNTGSVRSLKVRSLKSADRLKLKNFSRAPELLFVMPEHSTAVDLWAVACIFAEMIIRRELFPGRSVSGQIKIIVSMLGAPSSKVVFFKQLLPSTIYISN